MAEPRPTLVLRSRFSQTLAVAMALAAGVGLVMLVQDGVGSLVRYGALMLLFAHLGWAAFWQPHVEVSDGGVAVANTWRTVEVPWPAVQSVEGRYGLRLRTAYGVVTAWSAPAPTGKDRAAQRQGVAADAVTERLELLRAAGHLDAPRLERPRPKVAWHAVTLVTAVVLAVASGMLLLVG